jgi:N-glycosidase YbiA
VIRAFTGRYRFLSNFYPAIVLGPSCVCETVEHAYQAWKTVDVKEQRVVAAARTAADAKRLGRKVTLRGDWNDLRLGVMKSLLDQKFTLYTELGDALLGTLGEELVEGNNWHDRFWGGDAGGENWLGRLLMLRRSELYFQL